MKTTIGIVNHAMKTTLTLCKNVKWMHVWTKHQKGKNMAKKKTIKKVYKTPDEIAEEKLLKAIEEHGV